MVRASRAGSPKPKAKAPQHVPPGPGVRGHAVGDFVAEGRPELRAGDMVEVLETHESGWSYAKNLRNSNAGWIPTWLVEVSENRLKGLGRSIWQLYGALALCMLLFALLAEASREPVPVGMYRGPTGLIDLEHFNATALGPYPKCHPRHGQHWADTGWRSNDEAQAPFPPGHPRNSEFLSKATQEHLTWTTLQSFVHLLCLASLCLTAASKQAALLSAEPARHEVHVLEPQDAYWAPVVGSAALLSIFVVIKYLSAEWLKQLLQLLILASCTLGTAENVEELLRMRPAAREAHVSAAKWLCAAGLAVAYGLTKHWLLNNLLGLSFCLLGIRHVKLASFRTGLALLGGLFLYDVFWVFFSQRLFGSNVMVSVAQGLEAPMKLLIPRGQGGCGERRYGLLGLGDIAVPGLFTALLARWDVQRMAKGLGQPFAYLNVAVGCYVLSLATTMVVMMAFNHAQPALLYICPYLVLGSTGLALSRGELKELLSYTTEAEKPQ